MRLPKLHQYQGYIWLRENPRGMCLDEMRLGKSYSALMSVKGLGPGLILCPASARGVWRDEFLIINPGARIDIARGRSHAFRPDADAYIVGYDILADNFHNIPYHAKYNWVLPDEFHRLKNPEARRTGAAQAIIRHARIAHPLSGTPIPSRPIEWWPVLHALGVTDLSWLDFAYRYAAAWAAPWATNSYGGVDARGASNLDELRALIAPHVIRRTKEQVIPGYIPPEIKLITFDRPVDKQESMFSPELLRQYENPLISIEGLAEVMKLSALKKIPDCVEFIEDRLNEVNKIIVFFWNKDIGSMLQSALAIYPSVTVTGDTTPAQRDFARKEFQSNPAVRLFFGNILSAGEALDLSAADTSVFVQTTWVPKDLLQAMQRTESMAKIGRQSIAYILTTENSLDHYQLNAMFKKMNIIDQVLSPT